MLSNIFPNLAYYRARNTPQRPAILDYNSKNQYTYQDLEDRSEKLACFLTQTLGLKKGSRAGFLASNDIAFFDLFYASCKTGIVITTYNGRLRVQELMELVRNEEPEAILFTENFREKVESIKAQASNSIILVSINGSIGDNDRYYYKDIMSNTSYAELEAATINYDDPQILIHSGGTTGIPKAATHSFGSIFMNAVSEILTWQLTGDDKAYIACPLYHVGGLNLLTLPLLLTGAQLVLTSDFDPFKFLRISVEETPTLFFGVETMFRAISNHPDFAQTDLSSYKWMISGGSPLADETLKPYWDKGIRIFNGYGMTESGASTLTPNVDLMTLMDNKKKTTTVGKPFFFTEVKIVDEKGNEVEQGKSGELLIRSEYMFTSYWNNEEATQDILKDGWIHTGDVGYCDKDGDIYICDRLKNMFITSGENIYPAEIEKVLIAYPGIADCCVIGVADESDASRGEVGKAIVVLAPGAEVSEEDIRRYLKQELSGIKRPQFIDFAESIPRNAMGKKDLNFIHKVYGNKLLLPCKDYE